jgi:predicted membrane protein DUF2232
MLPFAYLISGSVMGLITLRKGSAVGLQIIVASLLVLQVFSVIANIPLLLSVGYALLIWLPVWFASSALRLTEQQGLLVFAVGVFATLIIVAAYLIIGDVTNWWQQWFDVMLEEAVPPEQIDQYKDIVIRAAPMVNALMVAGLMLNIIISVLCARWWQSRLFNPGAFRKEFYDLRLPVLILPVSGMVAILSFVLPEPWLNMFRDIMVVLMFMYLIQGISSVHRNVEKFNLSTAWVVSMYCLLILLPQMGLFIACLGMTDIYVGWRRKKTGSENES